jgi:hypothetical protein
MLKVRWKTAVDIALPAGIALLMIVFYVFMFYANTGIINGSSYAALGDDSYISVRYAKNFYEGNGFAWNVGEAPVEGFTNFLWVLWIAFLMLFAGDPTVLMFVSSAGFHIAAVVLLYRFLRKKAGSGWVLAGVLSLLMASWKPIHVQVRNGLEGPLLLVLFMTAMYLIITEKPVGRRMIIGAWIAGLLPLVRPSGLYYTGVLLACFVFEYVWPERENLVEAIKKWRWVWAGFFAPFFLITLFRVVYFGDWLPNTYYLKVSNRPGRIGFGMDYVYRFYKSFYGTPFLIPMFLYFQFKSKPWQRVLVFGLFGNLAYVAYQGGDAWDNWRFMLLFLPVFLVLTASLFKGDYEKRSPVKFFMIGIVAVLLFSAKLDMWTMVKTVKNGSLQAKPSKIFRTPSAENIRLGLLLKSICSKDAVIGEFWAGAVPYYSELTTIDMLGKSDRHIARLPSCKRGARPGHDKFDFDYVVGLKPDIIISRYKLGAADAHAAMQRVKKSYDPAGAVLLTNRRFLEEYRPLESVLSKRWRGIYVRIDSDKYDLTNLEETERNLL